jgi:putative ABC transport system permease protein
MRRLNGLIPRNLVTRKARTLLTTLGIALGVAAVVATGVVRESATRSVADMFDHAAGRADLAVTNAMAGITGGAGFDAVALEHVRMVEGVERAAPLLQVVTLPTSELDAWKYSFIFGNFNGAVVYGVDPSASRDVGHYRLAAGKDLEGTGNDALLLSEQYAQSLGVDVGDSLELTAPAGQVRLTVTGLLASDGLARLNRGQVGLTGLETAQRLFERPGRLDQIDVVATSGTDVDSLKGQLEATLGAGFRVVRPASKGQLIDQMLQSVAFGMGFIGTLSLVVGGFLIYNTFAMTVAERTRELGLLRALGSGQGQIVALVLAEAALLGLAGAALGMLLGLVMAFGMRQLAGAVVDSELTALVVLPEHLLLGLAVGVVVALVASLIPALQAGRLQVVEALQQRRAGDGETPRLQIIIGLALAVPSLAITVIYCIRSFEMPFEFVFTALISLLVGVALLIPVAIPHLERLAGGLLGLLGVEGQLGGRNLAHSPGRAALTAGALMFGLASVIVIGGVFAGAKELADDYMKKALAAELWVYAPERLPRGLADELETLPEVRLARPAASIPTRIIPPGPDQPEVAVVFTAIDPERSRQLDFYFASDSGRADEAIPRLAAGGAVFIANPLREWYGLDVGDKVRVQTVEGPTEFEIAGVTLNLSANGYSLLGVYDDALRYFNVDGADIVAVNLIRGADASAVGRHILDTWGGTYNLKFETQDEFRARSAQLSDSFAAFSNTAVLVAVVVAALGVANTLLMNVLERRRELGMLRSLGMTQGQIVRLILAESVALGLLGGLLGVALGAWLSRFAVVASTSVAGYELPDVFPVQAVVVSVVIALVVPLLAGLWPAWRGAHANVVEAMRSE